MKLFEVEFFNLTFDPKSSGFVSNMTYAVHKNDKTKFINVENGLLVKESDLDEVKNYGGGIKKLVYVGDLWK